jgi:hypothetical protein
MPMCSSPSTPPSTSILLPASGDASRVQHRPTINLGADIFLADAAGRYLGRICHYRECRPRVACRALSCGLRQHLNDDLQIVTLSPTLVGAPPIDLWPRIVARCAVPADTQALLVAKLDDDPHDT